MAEYKALIWDFDGCLVDTEAGILSAVDRALKKTGVTDVSMETIAKSIGGGARAGMLYCLGEARAHLVDAAVENFKLCYYEDPTPGCRCYPGILEALKALAPTHRMAVCTAKFRVPLLKIMKLLELEPYFDCIVAFDDVSRPKPDGEGAEKALAALGVSPKEALFIGDAPTDIACAHNASVPCCCVTWGYGDPEKNAALHPEFTVDSAAEILALCGV